MNKEIQKPISFAKCSIKTRDCQVRRLQKNLDIIRDNQGTVIGGIERFEDVTDRLIAEDAIKEAQSRYQSLFTDSPNSLWIADFSEVKHCLEKLRSISGIEPEAWGADSHRGIGEQPSPE